MSKTLTSGEVYDNLPIGQMAMTNDFGGTVYVVNIDGDIFRCDKKGKVKRKDDNSLYEFFVTNKIRDYKWEIVKSPTTTKTKRNKRPVCYATALKRTADGKTFISVRDGFELTIETSIFGGVGKKRASDKWLEKEVTV